MIAKLKTDFDKKYPETESGLQSMYKIQQRVLDEAKKALPAEFKPPEEASQLKELLTKLTGFKEDLEKKHTEWKNTTDKSKKATLEASLKGEFEDMKATYAKFSGEATRLVSSVASSWKAYKEANAQATLPITATENDQIKAKDATTAQAVQKDVIDAYNQRVKDNNVWTASFKEDLKAVGLYFELSAMVIGIFGPALVAELAGKVIYEVVEVSFVPVSFLGSLWNGKPKTFNNLAPHPWGGKQPPSIG